VLFQWTVKPLFESISKIIPLTEINHFPEAAYRVIESALLSVLTVHLVQQVYRKSKSIVGWDEIPRKARLIFSAPALQVQPCQAQNYTGQFRVP
jgi:hypothetical protein